MSAGVTSRSVLTGTAAVLAGGIVGLIYGRKTHTSASDPTTSGYGAAEQSGSGGPSGAARERTPLAPLTAVPVGGGLIRSGVVVTRPSAGAVHAFTATCTHRGCTVNEVDGGKIFCPCHGSVFDATTGAVVAGPAPAPLARIGVTVTNGKVYLS